VSTPPSPRFVSRLRLAGCLVIAGLAVQAIMMIEPHPLTFIGFMVPGVVLVMAGLVALVWATVAR
jgi:hypothetical protein